MSSADKVYAVWEKLKGYTPKGSMVSMDVALTRTDDTLARIERGAL